MSEKFGMTREDLIAKIAKELIDDDDNVPTGNRRGYLAVAYLQAVNIVDGKAKY